MINVEMARDYIVRARRFLKEAEMALIDEDNATSIRRSQEALEMAVKALLRALGIEYPRSHDVSDVLIDHKDALPEGLKSEVRDLAKLVSQLASIRVQLSTAMRGKEYQRQKPSARIMLMKSFQL